ncbi:MAG TPA: acyl carrier protein [Nitrospirae bacterium]|nr:acyl carrier protein [Nitrospirota bacterium]
MTGEGIRQAIIDIIREIVPDEDLSGIDAEKPLRDQIDLDSMDFLDIVMELRKRYSVEVPEQDYQELESMSSTVNYLLPKMESL